MPSTEPPPIVPHKCIVQHCEVMVPYTWFCREHYMAKELNYAYHDICASIDGEDESGVRLDIAKGKVEKIMHILYGEPKENHGNHQA